MSDIYDDYRRMCVQWDEIVAQPFSDKTRRMMCRAVLQEYLGERAVFRFRQPILCGHARPETPLEPRVHTRGPRLRQVGDRAAFQVRVRLGDQAQRAALSAAAARSAPMRVVGDRQERREPDRPGELDRGLVVLLDLIARRELAAGKLGERRADDARTEAFPPM